MAWFNRSIDFLSDTFKSQQNHLPLLAAAGASFTLGFVLHSTISKGPLEPDVLRAPRKATVSDKQDHGHPLPSDVLPGARDVATPYGSIRVYEWGPEDGPKILFVHGITTPCISLGGLAHALVDRGFRVMLFDLFGRGYSDAPSDLPQDDRLFATQILLALASSPISWTGAGSGKFSLAGYSLGGGIVAAFASYFPQLITSLFLLGPSGMIRDNHISFQSRFLYSHGLVPESILTVLVRRRLSAGPLVTPKDKSDQKFSAEDVVTEEFTAQESTQVLSRAYPRISLADAVNWQVGTHVGFVHSFMSSMRFGPILQQRQFGTWNRLGKFLASQHGVWTGEREKGLTGDKVFIITGVSDPIIIKDELIEDATAALEGNVQFKFLDAGHEFPSTKYDEVAQFIEEKVCQE